ncbi:MAG: protein kinase domain-containing protein [Aureliella sp.]
MKHEHECDQSQFLGRLVEEQLPADERSRMEVHLETCSICQSTLDAIIESGAEYSRLCMHLRHPAVPKPESLQVVMENLCSTTGVTGNGVREPIRIHDFAVDYLHPTDNPNAMGRIGSYEITEVIGRGGMGLVLKGLDTKLNRIVAIKVLSPSFALNPTARKRFVREGQAAAAVAHPNVVTIYSVDEDRLPYLVMELVDGPSLQQRLDSEGFLHLHQILRIGVQIASGLASAHAQGLVHRDIKPANILLESGLERVKLTDFGLARAADDASVTRDGAVVGTPQYMSPEQARGESVNHTSDLFSLGSVLYTLAAGRPPFRAESSYGVMRKITDESPVAIRELNPEIPEWLCNLIDKLMAKKKEERFQSVIEVRDLLQRCLGHAQQPTQVTLPEIPKVSRTGRVASILKPIAGVTAMLASMTGLLFALSHLTLPQPAATPGPKPKPVAESRDDASRLYEQAFQLAFPNPDDVGTLNVDIKRGSIKVMGYDGNKILVDLSVPNFQPAGSRSRDGLQELRPNSIDFDVEESKEQIKLDGNSYKYITNLTIKVPRKTNLILDTYRDGIITVKGTEGTLNLRSQNCDIRIDSVSGSGRLWSYNGSLSADLVSITEGEPLALETYNGSIGLRLPSQTNADLRYRSGSGKVLTDMEITVANELVEVTDSGQVASREFVSGTLNDGGSPITLETEKGDIKIQKRMSESPRR